MRTVEVPFDASDAILQRWSYGAARPKAVKVAIAVLAILRPTMRVCNVIDQSLLIGEQFAAIWPLANAIPAHVGVIVRLEVSSRHSGLGQRAEIYSHSS